MNTALVLNRIEVTYQIVTSRCKTDGCQGAVVYGLKIIHYGDIYKFSEIEDISCNKQDVENLISRLIMEDVHPDQLIYIVEDYMAELYS